MRDGVPIISRCKINILLTGSPAANWSRCYLKWTPEHVISQGLLFRTLSWVSSRTFWGGYWFCFLAFSTENWRPDPIYLWLDYQVHLLFYNLGPGERISIIYWSRDLKPVRPDRSFISVMCKCDQWKNESSRLLTPPTYQRKCKSRKTMITNCNDVIYNNWQCPVFRRSIVIQRIKTTKLHSLFLWRNNTSI